MNSVVHAALSLRIADDGSRWVAMRGPVRVPQRRYGGLLSKLAMRVVSRHDGPKLHSRRFKFK